MKGQLSRSKTAAVLRSAAARRILNYVGRQPVRSTRTMGEILGLDAQVVVHHLHLLEDAGLIEWVEAGDVRFCQVTVAAEPFLAAVGSGTPARVEADVAVPSGTHRPLDSHMVERLRERSRSSS